MQEPCREGYERVHYAHLVLREEESGWPSYPDARAQRKLDNSRRIQAIFQTKTPPIGFSGRCYHLVPQSFRAQKKMDGLLALGVVGE